MARKVIIELNPRPQFRRFIESPNRFACVVAHRRAGKTFACVQKLIQRALGYKREGPPCRYGYIAPTRDQAKDIAWQYLCEYSRPIPGLPTHPPASGGGGVCVVGEESKSRAWSAWWAGSGDQRNKTSTVWCRLYRQTGGGD